MGKPTTTATPSFQSTSQATAITHTEAAVSGKTHSLQWANMSYSADQTLTITLSVYDGSAATGTLIHQCALGATKDFYPVEFPDGLWGTEGNAMTIVMSATDGAELGQLNTKVLTY